MRFGAILLADSGALSFEKNGAISSLGVVGSLTLSAGAGATSSAGGTLTLKSGTGGSTSGDGGPLQITAGAATGTTGGAGGAISITAGASAGSTGGPGGAVSVQGGAGAGSNQNGGGISLTGGAATGVGSAGSISLTAASNTSASGANVVLTPGAGNALATDGLVQISRVPTANRAARLRFIADDGTTVDLKAPAAATSYAMTWPVAVAPVANSVLQSTTGGALSWSATAGVVGPATSTDTAIATWNGGTGSALRNTTLTISGQTLSTPAAAAGNAVNLTGGTGSTTSGGSITLAGGAATSGSGGAITLLAGAAGGTNQAGAGVNITAGAPTGTGTPGAVTILGANAAGVATGGLVTLAGGASTTSIGGNVVLRGGRGSAVISDGVVQLDRTATDNRATRLRFVADDNTTVDVKAPAAATSYALVLPTAQGAASAFLQNNGGGVLSWVSQKLLQTLFTEIAVDTTTTSLTFVALLSQAVTTVAGSVVIVNFTCAGSNSANNRSEFFQLLIDGVATRGTGFGVSVAAGAPGSAALTYRATGLAAGAHTFAIQWRVSASTGQIRPVTVINEHASLLIQEVLP